MPARMRCSFTSNLFIHFIYGNHTDGAEQLVGVKMVGTQKTTPSGFACHPSTGGEWSAPKGGYHEFDGA